MRNAKQAALTGKAGEFVVAAQLLIRGIVPSWPAVDMGCDLLASNGCRIQVRSAHLYHHNKGYNPVYFFPLPKTRIYPNSSSSVASAKVVARKPFVERCDVVIFWGIEQNRFWIVPASLCDQTTGVELGLDSTLKPRFVGSVAEMREMLGLGYTRGQVAKHYGIARTSLQQFLDSGKDFVDETVTSRMRAYEGRWELVIDFVRPETPVEIPPQVPDGGIA